MTKRFKIISSQECSFNKIEDNTYLRVAFQGNLRILCTGDCCKRWYFTFNGVECTVPATIDASLYQNVQNTYANVHRPGTQEGYCGGISKGIVRVGFSVGNCVGGTNADAATGWSSVSRIIVEEVNPPQ